MIRLKTSIWTPLYFILILTLAEGCKKDDDNPPSDVSCSDGIQNGQEIGIDCGGPDCSPCAAQGTPTVVTLPMDEINPFSARAKGQIIDEGDSSLTGRGFVFSASPNPDTSDFRVSASSNNITPEGIMTALIYNLSPGSTYYVKAYARNAFGYAYGEEVVFTTPFPPPVTAAWIDNADGRLYACTSNGLISRKSYYDDNWYEVDNDGLNGVDIRTAWIDEAVGHLYAATSEGHIYRKTTYSGNWSEISDNNIPDGELQSCWIDDSNFYLYGLTSLGKIYRLQTYTSNWQIVDSYTISTANFTSAWIDPGNFNLYMVSSSGRMYRKTSYTGSYYDVANDIFDEQNIQSAWIDNGNGYLYGISSDGLIQRKTSYTGSWNYVSSVSFW